MNTCVLSLVLALLAAPAFCARSAPFTYQGLLSDTGRPAQASYDLVFRIYNAETSGTLLATPVFVDNLPVASGHLVATLDFGDEVFNGQSRWLEIAVRRAGSPADYTTLLPRHLITAAPYAITALNLAGVIPTHIGDTGSSNLLSHAIQSPLRVQGDGGGVGEIRVTGGEVVFSGDNTSSDHPGTQLLLQAGDGIGPDKNGGNIVFVPGLGTGDGRVGRVVIDGAVKVTGPIAATALFADGSGIVNLAASNLTGVLANQQLAGSYANAVQFANASNQFAGAFSGDGTALSLSADQLLGTLPGGALSGTYGLALNLVNSANDIRGSFAGDGGSLSNVNASKLEGFVSADFAQRNASNYFTAEQTFAGPVAFSNAVSVDGNLHVSGELAAAALSGNGSAIRNLAATNVVGILGSAQLQGTYDNAVQFTSAANQFNGSFSGNGAGLANLNAATLTGVLPNAALSGAYGNAVSLPNAGNTFRGTFAGDGSKLANVAASNIVGVLASARLQGAYSNVLQLSNAANQFSGTFNGDGGALSNVNASRLEGFAGGAFAQRNASNYFSAAQTFAGPVAFSNAVSIDGNLQVSGAVSAANLSGNGSAIRNLAASNVIGILGSAQVQGTYGNTVQFTSAANQFNGAFTGNGGALANLNAGSLTGLVPNASISGTYANALNLPNPANTFQGAFTGDGSKLANVAASNIVGVLASARLQGAYSNALQLSNPANQFSGTFSGDGSAIRNLPASNVVGVLGSAQVQGAYGNTVQFTSAANQFNGVFTGNGTGLGNLNASSLTGLVPSASLGGTYGNALNLPNGANTFQGTFAGDGSGLGNISAATLTGTLPNSLLAGAYNNSLTLGNPANILRGSFGGDGGGISNLNASGLSTGTVPDARLSANVATLNSSPTFTGSVTAQADLLASRLSVGSIGTNTTNPPGRALLINGVAGITSTNTLEFGADVPGKHPTAGKIGYQTLTPGALDIVGAGTNTASRRIKFWADRGATFNGAGSNSLVVISNTVDESTSLALAAPFSTWRVGQNKPPDAPGTFDAFFVYQESAAQTRLLIADNGHIGIGTNNPVHPLDMASGAFCSVGGQWTSVSDRNAKKDFQPIRPREVLAKVAALPITEWSYKSETNGVYHLGPMAQDFHAAFGLGENEKVIGGVDADGVALAAIQGLNEIVQEKNAEIRELQARNDALEKRLKALESAITHLR